MRRIVIRVRRKPETDEWLVLWTSNGKRNEGRTSYHADFDDAMDTLRWLARKNNGIAIGSRAYMLPEGSK